MNQKASDELGNCGDCGVKVQWAKTVNNNNNMPVDVAEPEKAKANLTLFRNSAGELRVCVVKVGDGTHISHFATCRKRR